MIDETQSSQAISRAVEAKREYMRKALREDNLFHYESQTTCCTPIFGDMTEQVIDDFFRGAQPREKPHAGYSDTVTASAREEPPARDKGRRRLFAGSQIMISEKTVVCGFAGF